ncbi:MAG: MBL fold metallo-hydrolase [Acidimicrobiales bacterium]
MLDLGTGLRFWGQTLRCDGSFRGTALVTHLHWDHVQGLPFFAPINCPGASIDVYAPPPELGTSVSDAFGDFMRPPYFPVRASDLFGDIRFHDASACDMEIGAAVVKVRAVPHVGATNGYRIEYGGVVVAYVSDHQQPVDDASQVADSVLELCDGADLVIHDAQYDDADFAVKQNWGHCTVDYAVHVAAMAGARRLALFHHDPVRTDSSLDGLLARARTLGQKNGLQEVMAAAEGLTLSFAGTSLGRPPSVKVATNGAAANGSGLPAIETVSTGS